MVLDLTGVRQLVQDLFMGDTCTIERDTDLTEDEVWDPETMTYSGGDALDEVYDGICYVSSAGMQPLEESQGGAQTQESWYFLNIPLETAEVQDGDLVTITGVHEKTNPDLLGETFVVQQDQVGTFKVKTKIRMRRVTRLRTS